MFRYKTNKERPYLYCIKGDVSLYLNDGQDHLCIDKAIPCGTDSDKAIKTATYITSQYAAVEFNGAKVNIIPTETTESFVPLIEQMVLRGYGFQTSSEKSSVITPGSTVLGWFIPRPDEDPIVIDLYLEESLENGYTIHIIIKIPVGE